MRTKSLVGAGAWLLATALTPANAADMTNDRMLNPQREPQNWLLHHGNYQGHRFSALKEINTDTVKNLRPAKTIAPPWPVWLPPIPSSRAPPSTICGPTSSVWVWSIRRISSIRCASIPTIPRQRVQASPCSHRIHGS